jgi:hypothetical protein
MTMQTEQPAVAENRLVLALKAAEVAATLGWPQIPCLVEDLHLRWDHPAEFGALHGYWLARRWGFDVGEPVNWAAQDRNPWACLLECLGVHGCAFVVAVNAGLPEIERELADSQLTIRDGDWDEWDPGDGLTGKTALAALAARAAATGERMLVRLIDNWSDGIIVAEVRRADYDRLRALGQVADIYGLGLEAL